MKKLISGIVIYARLDTAFYIFAFIAFDRAGGIFIHVFYIRNIIVIGQIPPGVID